MESVQDPETSEMFSVLRCASCGLESTYPVPENLAPYYEDQYYGNRHGWTDRACIRRRLKFLGVAHSGRRAGRILDFGCGDGAFLRAARGAGWNAAGTEINAPEMGTNIPVFGGLDELPADANFDCITFWHTLEHVVDPKETLSRAIEHLAPDGTLLLAVPNAGGLQARLFGRHWLHRDVPRHLHHFNDSAMETLLESVGCMAFRRWFSEWEYDWMGWAQSLLNALFSPPNAFFNELRGIPTTDNRAVRAARLASGCIAVGAVSPMMLVDLFTPRGGTMILAARRS